MVSVSQERGIMSEEYKDNKQNQGDSNKDKSSMNKTDDNYKYEDVCMICHRPESKAGRMFHLPNNICICDDCMHRTMDTMGQYDFQGMFPPELDFGNIFGQTGTQSTNTNSTEVEEKNGTQNDSYLETTKEDTTQVPNDAKEKETSDNQKKKNYRGFPNVSFINLADLQGMGGVPNRQKVKKKTEGSTPQIDLKNIPAPHKMKEQLDEFVIGQDKAKKILSVAVYNHYKRVATDTMNDIEIEKSNILMVGPTGCGKTYLVQTLARLLNVPLAIADATTLTEAGYIGDDIESVVSKLLAAADNDVARAETGIIFVDEIDKIAKKKNTNSRDVSGESVQQGLLKILEGAEIEVPVGANSKNAMVPLTTVNTRNILFICGGAFPGLEEVVKQRLTKQTGIGFSAELKDKFDKENNILCKTTAEDIKKFGMIPEFVGRLPILCTLENLDEDALVKILEEPKNAILKQYQKLLELDEVQLIFDESALHAIAKKALTRDTGARGLRAVIEEFMLDIMYEIPKDENIGRVTITGDYIDGTGVPIIDIRSNQALAIEELNQIPLTEEKSVVVNTAQKDQCNTI